MHQGLVVQLAFLKMATRALCLIYMYLSVEHKDFLAALIEVVLSTESEVTAFHGTILVMKCKHFKQIV